MSSGEAGRRTVQRAVDKNPLDRLAHHVACLLDFPAAGTGAAAAGSFSAPVNQSQSKQVWPCAWSVCWNRPPACTFGGCSAALHSHQAAVASTPGWWVVQPFVAMLMAKRLKP